jgi:hypothetical protein
MAPKFRVRYQDGASFGCTLQCATCNAATAAGGSCRLRACQGMPTCWIHTLKLWRVKKAASTVPGGGMGLFVWNPKHANDVVYQANSWMFPYVGEAMTKAVVDARYPGDNTATYALCNGNTCVDSACRRGWASYINHRAKANAEYRYRKIGQQNEMWIKAKTSLRHGQEIFCNYGGAYQFHGSQHSTR